RRPELEDRGPYVRKRVRRHEVAEALGNRSAVRVEDVALVLVTQSETEADRSEGASVAGTELIHVPWIVRVVRPSAPVGHEQALGWAQSGRRSFGEVDVVGRQRIAVGVVGCAVPRGIEAELEVLTLYDPQLPGAERQTERQSPRRRDEVHLRRPEFEGDVEGLEVVVREGADRREAHEHLRRPGRDAQLR